MLVKYREELTRPIDEAMEFLKRVEAQLDSIAGGGSSAARLSLAGNDIKKKRKKKRLQQQLLLSLRSPLASSYMVVRRPHAFLLPYVPSAYRIGNG